MSVNWKQWLRWLGRGLVLLLVIGIVGRQVQVYWQSRLIGERGPYLQMLAEDTVTVRWQSEAPYRGVVHYGTHPQRLDKKNQEAEADTIHELRLTGLEPATRYYYSIGSDRGVDQGGEDYWFVTAPETGVIRPVRLWVQGDPGYPTLEAEQVRDSAFAWMEAHPREGLPLLDLWLTTGDNAYRSGSNAQFQKGLFRPYAEQLRNYSYWPVYGNHDARRRAFFPLFTFPTQGESGGVPSGSEHYYSVDYAHLHLVFLDTESEDMDAEGEMLGWLQRDLKAIRLPWTVVLFHHPPYTRGSHDSDDEGDSKDKMGLARENILPILERHSVDLVLSGHSHAYERSHLIACHYGKSDGFGPQHVLDGESPYIKGEGAQQGTIYAVVGSSSQLNWGGGVFGHPAAPVALKELGSLVIDVAGERLEANFINEKGEAVDHFVIEKGGTSRKAACH